MSERTPPTRLRYRQALRWLYAFSDTERTGAFVRDRDDNLARERALLAALGDPQRTYGIIHIAGTKGKGSTSAMIASILQAAGVRTGPLHLARPAHLPRAHPRRWRSRSARRRWRGWRSACGGAGAGRSVAGVAISPRKWRRRWRSWPSARRASSTR